MILPADITRCASESCPDGASCLRYLAWVESALCPGMRFSAADFSSGHSVGQPCKHRLKGLKREEHQPNHP